MTRTIYAANAVLAAAAVALAAGGGNVVPRATQTLGRKERDDHVKQVLDNAYDEEANERARHNASVDRKKAERRMRRLGRFKVDGTEGQN